MSTSPSRSASSTNSRRSGKPSLSCFPEPSDAVSNDNAEETTLSVVLFCGVTPRIRHGKNRNGQRRLETKVDYAGATFIGEDHGEWGGTLSVVDASGGAPKKILLNKNILQLFALENGVAVITGDLPANEGSIWLYAKVDGGTSSIQKKADLSGFPRVIGRSGNRILIAYGDGVSVIDSDFNNRLIVKLPINYVQPNSIVRDARGNIYVGMNAFVVRLVPGPSGYSQEWFIQQACLQ